MTVLLADFLRQETGQEILGDDASLARTKVVSSLPTFLEGEVKTLFLMYKLTKYNERLTAAERENSHQAAITTYIFIYLFDREPVVS